MRSENAQRDLDLFRTSADGLWHEDMTIPEQEAVTLAVIEGYLDSVAENAKRIAKILDIDLKDISQYEGMKLVQAAPLFSRVDHPRSFRKLFRG